MTRKYQVLTDEQAENFLQRGHVVLHECFPREWAQELTDRAFIKAGYDKNDPSTWEQPRVALPTTLRFPVKEVAPRVWAAIEDLLGPGRAQENHCWGNGFITNFGIGADEPWQPPSPDTRGWHKDGDFFRHFLDSPEQGLLTIVLFSDIRPKGGGTFVACDSVAPVARCLAEHPEGLMPGELPTRELIRQCSDFIEITGNIGDVVLIHPYVLHSASQNHSGKARFIINPPVKLKEPMNFNREDPAEFSLVEQGVLRGLGVERYEFEPTEPRDTFKPKRVSNHREIIEQQNARLVAAGLEPEEDWKNLWVYQDTPAAG